MAYAVLLRPAAQRQLDRLRGVWYLAMRGVILALADEARPPGSIKLSGSSNLWRLRIRVDGRPWRIVYRIDDTRQEIVVTRVAPHDEGTYRGM
ncbi:MAG TPA: type II toxin-antitoxin system RelE/ParE family toxin [Candidatus Limnocylindrales bacterium]|nr:type II toxin-antitoxin system RelE/ParE family toxin [Candidatus Limnocylindrales bacterium]